MFEGTLNKDSNDVMWRELPSMLSSRAGNCSFILQNQFAVAGGEDLFNMFSFSFFVAGMNILISTGYSTNVDTSSSRLIQLTEIPQNITVQESIVQNFPTGLRGCFSSICNGRAIVGGGGDGWYWNVKKEVFEFVQDEWKQLP